MAAKSIGNALIVASLFILLFAPMSPVQRWYAGHAADKERAHRIQTMWDSIAGGSVVRDAQAPGYQGRILVEFGQYRCVYCRIAYDSILVLLADRPDLRYEYRHFPPAGDTLAELAARASLCADDAGHFQAMHQHLLGMEVWHTDLDWPREAFRAGVSDTVAFLACMGEESTVERVRQDVRVASQLKLDGTPSWVWWKGLKVGIGDMAGVVRRAAGSR